MRKDGASDMSGVAPITRISTERSANLGALLSAGFDVLLGCYLSTAVYWRFTKPALGWIAQQLAGLDIDGTHTPEMASAVICTYLERLPIPGA